jgi:hypothetical protein
VVTMMEQRTVPVVEAVEGEPLRLDAVTVAKKDRSIHLMYRWQEGGVDHVLRLALDTPILLPEDVAASLGIEGCDPVVKS